MLETVLITAHISTNYNYNKQAQEQKNSLLGVLLPLIGPVLIILYMMVEDINYDTLDSICKFILWGGVIFSVILWIIHQKASQQRQNEISTATYYASKESLTVTNIRIYGSTRAGVFSIAIEDVISAYCSRTVGQQPKLNIRTCTQLLEFEYVENATDIISSILRAKDVANLKSPHALGNNTSVVKDSNSSVQALPQDVLYDVVIVSGSGFLNQIKAIRQITSQDFATTKDLFSNLPCPIANGLTKEKAESIASELKAVGLGVQLQQSL